jgi:hypothetical protein
MRIITDADHCSACVPLPEEYLVDVSEPEPLTIEERFTRDLARRQAIVAAEFGGDEDAYRDHFFAALDANEDISQRPTRLRLSIPEKQARRAARKAKRYADFAKAFPSFAEKQKPTEWK